mmetsp:Transcript_3400/g.6435  ORF Transcript_3400/g.6435 Transcript_3400/m.6435 type:complete len:515 (+) Transcript_3400:23-1567(+)|eukprot:CAMPEP_0175138836 /NCGR_PEP_ID=MMETSP0087-20121206/10567_1 /TAXON_ID=136419 /ORGANISM="Unknown Unknown, Strain D1" /LENGTH=514 /DNA_ID=CAMNT_0016421777 /DNA_START=12 /DNA_END=1556 /DNA_ORIENTATION=+
MSVFTKEEVAKHNTKGNAWVIIDGNVYNVSKFARLHPGGEGVLMQLAGQDCTEEFLSLHKVEVLKKFSNLIIGTCGEATAHLAPQMQPGHLSDIPYGEPSFWQGWKTPFYTESHKKFRVAVRKIFTEHVYPEAVSSNAVGEVPSAELYSKLGELGMLAATFGPGPWLKHFSLPGGVKADEFDYFHLQIMHEEKNRMGLNGFQDGIAVGLVIGLPPVAHWAKPPVRDKVVGEVLSGTKKICLAISEPYAGSDVANIRTTATKSACGQFYIVNGVKKWITNGFFSDYFTVAVRTGGKGMGGISVLLVERSEGVKTKKMKTSYSGSSGTAYITFDNVKVPVGNLLGKENEGFKIIMSNFNHERWFIVCGVVAASRLVVEECMKWAAQRMVFGKPLIGQPVIRGKLAHMISQLESMQAWLELVTYQMNNMTIKEQSIHLAGPIALLKLRSTRMSFLINDEACQIFGGRAITQTGMGQIIERNNKAVKYGAILGGSEEIMADLGLKQAVKVMSKSASKL